MKSLKLYENIVIGRYLFDLGVKMAKLRPDLPLISVNLLQQTPLDSTLGDVFLANAGVCRIIEFKREGKLTKKEMKKLGALRTGIGNSEGSQIYERLSRHVHWYIEIQEPHVLGQAVVTRACPYLDFSEGPDFISIHEFAAAVAEEACQEEPDLSVRELRDKYVQWVRMQFAAIEEEDRAAATARGKRSSSSSVFLVAFNKNGEVYWLAVPSIEYTLMNQLELSQSLGLEIDLDTPHYEQKIGIDQGYGFS